MSASCPTCGKPVDTLRARHVAVRNGKITAFCSPECIANADPSKPNVAPRATPATGVVKTGTAPDSGPVIEIRYEPASGVVTSAPDTRDKKAEAKPEPKPEPPKAAESKPDTKKPRARTEPPGPPPKRTSEPKVEAPKEPKAEPKAEAKKRLEVIEQNGTAKPELPPGVEIKPGPAKRLSDHIEPVGPRRPGRETIKRDAANVEQADDWIDDAPADLPAVRAGTDVSALDPPRRGGRGVLVTLLVVALLAAGVVVAYKVLSKSSAGAPKTGSGSTGSASGSGSGSGSSAAQGGSGANKRVVGPPIDTDKKPLDRALETLEKYLSGKDSPRVQRLAAAALSRTGNKAAIERLADALKNDKLDGAGQLDVAYALARANDKRGLDALLASINAPRDHRLTAGRYLIQLENKRGIDALAVFLELPQNRVQVGVLLARASEPRGIKALEDIRADKTSSADDKAYATIGLGLAGKPEVMEDLRALLADNRFNPLVAEALALRKDEAARPVLVKQLGTSSLRVGAARALRLLSPERVPAEYLTMLVAALDDPSSQRDTELIPIAEAILLLAGPAEWASRT